MEQFNKLEERLKALEKKDEANTSTILTLRNEVIDLHRENMTCQMEAFRLASERSVLVDRVSQLETDQREVFRLMSERSALVERVSQLEIEVQDHVTMIRNMEQSISSQGEECMESNKKTQGKLLVIHNKVQDHVTMIRNMEQAISSQGEECMESNKKMQGKLLVIYKKLQRTEEITDDIVDDVVHLKKLGPVLNHMIVKAHTLADSETQNDDDDDDEDDDHYVDIDKETNYLRLYIKLHELNKKIEESQTQIQETKQLQQLMTTIFFTDLNTSNKLDLDTRVRLDKCDGLWFDEARWFDRGNGFLVPRLDCKMVLGWRMYQDEEGELKAYLRDDESCIGEYLGTMTYQDDVCSGVVMKYLKKGQRVWLEVKCVSGTARIGWCHFMGWVVG